MVVEGGGSLLSRVDFIVNIYEAGSHGRCE